MGRTHGPILLGEDTHMLSCRSPHARIVGVKWSSSACLVWEIQQILESGWVLNHLHVNGILKSISCVEIGHNRQATRQ